MPAIKPEEIRNHEFKRTVRGYDRDEVRYFLSMIADEYSRLLHQLNEAQTALQEIQSGIKKTDRTDEESILEKAREQAELIIAGAESKAALLIQKAKKEVTNLEMRISQLKTEKATLAIKIKRILQSHLDLIEMLEDQELSLDDDQDD